MLYDWEIWTLNLTHKKKFFSSEMVSYQRSAKNSKMDKVKNSKEREIVDVKQNILKTIQRNKLKL